MNVYFPLLYAMNSDANNMKVKNKQSAYLYFKYGTFLVLYGVGKQKTTFLKREMEKYCNIQGARNKKCVKPDKRILKLQILIHIKNVYFLTCI